jgi:hypothetical protein
MNIHEFGEFLKEHLGESLAGFLKSSFARGGAAMLKKNPAPPIPMGRYDRIDKPVSEFFTVGFAKADVMPDDIKKKKYYVAGYKAFNPATGVLDPMTVSAVWIDDNSGRGGVVLVSGDNVGLLSYDVKLIKESLEDFCRETGCRSVNIMSTHDHAGIDTMGYWGPLPRTGRDEDYMKLLREQVKNVVIAAYDDRRDGSLYYGDKEAPEIQRDSRPPQVYSKMLTRLRFVPNDGSREIYILNFASHSESLLGDNSLVSADFPCYIRREILEKCGAETIYFVGAIGGLIRLKELDPDNIKSTLIAGKALADTAMSIDNERRLSPVINILRQEFYIPVENVVMLAAVKIGIMKAEKYAVKGTPLGWALKTEMTYINIDGLQMILVPCELFPEVAYGGYLSAEESATGLGPEVNPKPMTEIANDDKLLVFGLANDEVGYTVPPNDFLLNDKMPYIDGGHDKTGRRHYEETNSLGPAVVPTIVRVFQSMMNIVNCSK